MNKFCIYSASHVMCHPSFLNYSKLCFFRSIEYKIILRTVIQWNMSNLDSRLLFGLYCLLIFCQIYRISKLCKCRTWNSRLVWTWETFYCVNQTGTSRASNKFSDHNGISSKSHCSHVCHLNILVIGKKKQTKRNKVSLFTSEILLYLYVGTSCKTNGYLCQINS